MHLGTARLTPKQKLGSATIPSVCVENVNEAVDEYCCVQHTDAVIVRHVAQADLDDTEHFLFWNLRYGNRSEDRASRKDEDLLKVGKSDRDRSGQLSLICAACVMRDVSEERQTIIRYASLQCRTLSGWRTGFITQEKGDRHPVAHHFVNALLP
jgi:hypothetical protein